MALTTYSELRASIANFLARDDLTDYIPDFITLFECAAARKLRVRPTETEATVTMSSGSGSLPSGYLGYKRVTWNGDTARELTYAHPSWLKAAYPSNDEGPPNFFTIEGSTLKVRPLSDENILLLYYARNSAVSASLNWLYSAYPDVYLFGSLCEAEGFVKDDARLALWKARRDEVFQEIKSVNFNEGSGLAVRTASTVV